MELLWQNGEVVLNSQSSRKQTSPVHKHGQSTTNPNNLIQDFETISWTDCPIDESFEKEFYEDILSGIPSSSNPVDPNKPFGKFDNEKVVNFGASEVDHVSLPLAPPIFDRGLDSVVKNDNFQLPVKKQATSHCASNLVVKDIDMARASSCGIRSKTMSFGVVGKYGRSVSPRYESTDKETIGQAMTSCSGGSGSSFWNQSNETDSRKRKSRDHLEESECRSDATELESAAGNKPSQKSGTSRRSRVAEVHNLSERRRRDRINERMRALQELIPHSNKSDKASMLDEAIEYMKSLQMQLQLMWMGSGMAPMMVPGMHNYMSRFGMGIGPPPMHPAIQNLMRLSRLPLIDPTVNMAARMNPAPVNYQNQMQISSYLDQYANYMGFHPMPNTSQPMNMFNIGFQSAQQNQALTPPHNGNGSIG